MFMKTMAITAGVCVGLLALIGCDADYNNKTRAYELPPEMSHCKVYRLTGDGTNKNMHVIHCPSDATHVSYKDGKVSKRNSTISY